LKIKYKNFFEVVKKDLEKYNYSKNYKSIIQGHEEKLGILNTDYESWIKKLINFFKTNFFIDFEKSKKIKILDFGSGTGELVIQMNFAGAHAKGVELHKKHLKFSRILAEENNLDPNIFVEGKDKKLNFKDNEFDCVTLFSVLEHIDDANFDWIFKEIRRVTRKCIYILVPNPIKPRDDHTGLLLLNYLPRSIALFYLSFRSKKYHYFLSDSGKWDVYYRFLPKLKKKFKKLNMKINFPPDEVIFPPLNLCPEVRGFGKNIKIKKKNFFCGIPFFNNFFINLGVEKQFFYPYLNFYIDLRSDKKN
jgi:ubiquinone/menaquinone biosynthesis C-methylase UbiE